MGDNQVIGATIQVDAASAAAASKTTTELKQNIKDLKKAFDDTKAGSAEQVEAYKKLQAAQKDLSKSTQDVAKAAEDTGGHFSNLRESVSSMPGPLGAAGEGANKLNAQLLKLLANPVGLVIIAIVGALTLLYKSFTNTFEGGEKMEQVFAGIRAAGQALLDNVTKIAGAILKLFKFDFSGAIDDIKGVAKAAGDAYNAMAALTKTAQELAREQADNDLDQAKRQAKLADLRAKAYDESIPIAARKAALKELQGEAQVNAKEDIDLAKRTAENKIAQLELEKDGAKKNYVEIQKIRADQIRNETENNNELKQIGKQLTAATKAELQERKEAEQKAAEEAKKRRQELVDFTNKLSKIQQDNELAIITDTYEKEKKVIENRIADEKRNNDVALQDKKITQDQFNQLNEALTRQAQLQLDALRDKHNKEVADKEAAFQKELASIRGKTSVDSLTDQRASERVQLQITHEQQLADAMKNYKDDAAKLQIIRIALAEQYRADRQKLEAKFTKEDNDKRLKDQIAKAKAISQDTAKSFKERLKAVDEEQAIVQKAFDDKTLSEAEYNAKVAEFAKDRMEISKQETEQRKQQVQQLGQSLTVLADLVGKQTIAGKAIGIATALINTYQGASEALKQKSVLPSPFDVVAKVVNVAAVIATGLKTVKSIAAVDVPGGGAGGSVPSAPSLTTPAAPVAPTQVSTTFNPQDNPNTGTPSTVRAYVVESDQRNAADRAARLERASRLGG